MKKFKFKAKNWSGNTVVGMLEVPSRIAALEVLRTNKLLPLSVEEDLGNFFSRTKETIFSNISGKQLANFTRQLSTMMTAGLPLTDALALLLEQTQGQGALQAVIENCLNSVRGGQSLATAMEKYKKQFGEAYVASIRAGEEGGVLEEILQKLSNNMEGDQEFRGKIKGALIYPAVVITGVVAVMFIMMVFVVPKMTSLYKDFGTKMPQMTLILISISTWAAKLWFLLPIAVIGGISVFNGMDKIPAWHLRRDKFLLKIPIMGKLMEQSILANTCRTLSMLLSAGVPLVESVIIVTRVADNEVFAQAYTRIASRVEKGFTLADSFSETRVFPVIVEQMVSTGEATGKLDEVLMRVSDYFTKEAEQSIKAITSAVEPLIMIMLGGVVGFLVVAIILPIYDLTSQF